MNQRYHGGFAIMSLTLIFLLLISMTITSSTYLHYLRIHQQHISQMFMQSTIKSEVSLDRFLVALYQKPELLSQATVCPITFTEEALSLSNELIESYKLKDPIYLCGDNGLYELGTKISFSQSAGESVALRKVAYSEGVFEWFNDTQIDF